MTKKDLITIAGVIRTTRTACPARDKRDEYAHGWNDALANLTEIMADELVEGNPQFDKAQFLTAVASRTPIR